MLYFIISGVITVVDFFVKRWTDAHLQKIGTLPIIENVFHLTYVENRGMAFGMLQNQRYFFILTTIAVLVAIVVFMIKSCKSNRFLKTGLSFVLGGAAGNLIDRAWLGYVIDLFDFRLINFPVFNVADIFVCLGAFFVIMYFLIYDDNKKDCEKNENNNI